MDASKLNLANFIDHTLLKPEATEIQIESLCAEAAQYQFFSVCVNSFWVATAKRALKESSVKVCTVVGFPLGESLTAAKVAETKAAIDLGADEIDMVLTIGALKSGDTEAVFDDIKAVVRAAEGRLVKVIFETCLLNEAEKIRACELSLGAGAQFVKTSTGFSTGGATVEDIQLMRKICGPDFGVKASGGIRNRDQAIAMINAGATRLGTSQSVAIVTGEASSSTSY